MKNPPRDTPVYQNLPGIVTVFVAGVQVAAAVNINHRHKDEEPQWRVMSTLRLEGAPARVGSLLADDEEHARDWLTFLAALYIRPFARRVASPVERRDDEARDRKSTRLNSSHLARSRMPSSA